MKSFPDAKRFCLVFQWISSCLGDICRATTSYSLRARVWNSSDPNTATTNKIVLSYIPATFDNTTYYQCFYDPVKESRSCCSELVKGLTGQKAMEMSTTSKDFIDLQLKVCLNYSKTCSSDEKQTNILPCKYGRYSP